MLYTDPRPIESLLEAFPHIGKIWVYGHNKSFLTAIIIPDYNTYKDKSTIEPAEKPANSGPTDAKNIKMEIEKEISSYNLSCQKYDQIVKFDLAVGAWTDENGFVNYDGTLNRKALYSKYRPIIENMYS